MTGEAVEDSSGTGGNFLTLNSDAAIALPEMGEDNPLPNLMTSAVPAEKVGSGGGSSCSSVSKGLTSGAMGSSVSVDMKLAGGISIHLPF